MNWLTLALKKYAVFTGRARRKEFWMFFLFVVMVYIVAIALDNILGISYGGSTYGPLYTIAALGLIIPTLAVGVRRLHDINKSGWYILVNLIPIVGGIWYLVMMFTEGDKGENQYGPDPKAEGDELSTL